MPSAHAHPWPARRPERDLAPAHQLRNLATWPAEPPVPADIDPVRFRAALIHMCGARAQETAGRISDDLLAAAKESAVDPFLLAGLVFYQSACNPNPKAKAGVGLLRIERSMYLDSPGAPELPVEREQLTTRNLLDPKNSLAVGARLLKMWDDAHPTLDPEFGGVPHRSGVAHFLWGDDVRSSGQEDLVFTARRRLVASYNAQPELPRASPLGVSIVSPLEGIPRVATSGPGEDRDGGARRHRGLDITAAIGEPVRAIADGRVIFAGANLGHSAPAAKIPPSKIARYAHRNLGVGGIYLCIEHDPEAIAAREAGGVGVPRKIVSCYMHLNSYSVDADEKVSAGQIIGVVGRTGVKVSPPHLHLEIRVNDRFTNPARYLTDMVIPPKATMTYRYVMKAKRARLRV